MIKARFSPSPTGLIHLGNARTALFNALFAAHHQGVFLLRIEDTDAERSREQFVDSLKKDLTWLGAIWQEGPDVEGDNGPYWQSLRSDVYENYYNELTRLGAAYPCFCSPEELELSRKMQRRKGHPPRYAGTCQHLTPEEIDQRIESGLKPTLRFHLPENELVEFEDLVRGAQQFKTNDIGDFIIRRANGTPSFMFSNAIDDSLMGVTHALRGEDHLTNTPRQLSILKVLNLTAPKYGHISLVMGEGSGPLSKRHGSKGVQDLREEGYLPIALVNYLARLGHTYTDHNDLMSFADCAKYFQETRLVKAPAKFDEEQLLHWQKEAVLALTHEQLVDWLTVVFSDVPSDDQQRFVDLVKPNILFPSDAMAFAKQFFGEHLTMSGEAKEVLGAAGSEFYQTAASYISEQAFDYQALCSYLKEQRSVKGKQLFMPLRAVLTGQLQGPELKAVFEMLGKERVLLRFTQAMELSAC